MATQRTGMTIAGSDPTGGAGAQADLLTFAAHGIQARAVLTAVTAQDEGGVTRVGPLPADHVLDQLESALSPGLPHAIKVGMVTRQATVLAIARRLRDCGPVPLVIDPVLSASAGGELLEPRGLHALRASMFPLATICTPNALEAAKLLECESIVQGDISDAARSLASTCECAVLITGGHTLDEGDESLGKVVDTLATPDGTVKQWSRRRLEGGTVHGTGCALSSSIAARLAWGDDLITAVKRAGDHVHRLIRKAHEQNTWIMPLLTAAQTSATQEESGVEPSS